MARILEIKNEDAYFCAISFALGGSQEDERFSAALEKNDVEWIDDFYKSLRACLTKRKNLENMDSVEFQSAKLRTFVAMEQHKRYRLKEDLKKKTARELFDLEINGKAVLELVERPLKPYEIQKELEKRDREFAEKLKREGGSERVLEKRIIRAGKGGSKSFLPDYRIKN